MDKLLKIGVWNTNGLSKHSLELKHFLLEHDIDVMLVSETHFTTKNNLRIHKYNAYHTMHPDSTAHGGSAVLIKNNIRHYVREGFQEEYLQATTVVIEDWSGSIVISAIYCPPKHGIKKNQYLAFFSTLGDRFISASDYNAKHTLWGSRHTLTKGRELCKAIDALGLHVVSTGEPTYWPTGRNKILDILDFAVVKGICSNYFEAESCLDLSSDHSPIILTLYKRVLERPCVLHNKETDWERFRVQVSSNLRNSINLKTIEDIEDALEHFNQCNQQTAWEATSELQSIKPAPKCPPHLADKLALKRRLSKQWQTTRNPLIKARVNKLIKEIKESLIELRNVNVGKYLQGLSPTAVTDYSLWKANKYLKQPQKYHDPIRRDDGNWARSDAKKAEVFAAHLSEVFKPNPGEVLVDEELFVREILFEPHQLEVPPK